MYEPLPWAISWWHSRWKSVGPPASTSAGECLENLENANERIVLSEDKEHNRVRWNRVERNMNTTMRDGSKQKIWKQSHRMTRNYQEHWQYSNLETFRVKSENQSDNIRSKSRGQKIRQQRWRSRKFGMHGAAPAKIIASGDASDVVRIGHIHHYQYVTLIFQWTL